MNNTGLCAAIKSRAVIEFDYEGGIWTVEPHCHGVSAAGEEVLRAYQPADSGQPLGWKLFEVARISGLRQTGAVFSTIRPDYTPHDRSMRVIHCRI